MILEDVPHPGSPYVFVRGNPGNHGPEVPRRFLALLSGPDRKPFQQGSGRLEMAQRIASADNPLTARVLVNRVWQHHFGEGFVRTPSDFGMRSDPPTHPELLDYLAWRFTHEGWSLKKLHRSIMLSNAYQQSSAGSPESWASDPENRLLAHMNRRRLDWESTRDSLLAATGDVDWKPNGPSVDLLSQPFSRRRTVFGYIDRQNLPGVFRTFDIASPDSSSPQRHVTTVPQQALYLMNSPFVVEQAQRLIKRPEIADDQRTDPTRAATLQCAIRSRRHGRRTCGGARIHRGQAERRRQIGRGEVERVGAVRSSPVDDERVFLRGLKRIGRRRTAATRRDHFMQSPVSRREMLGRCGLGFGAVALADLLGQAGLLSATANAAQGVNPLLPKAPQFAAKAKRVIHLFINGGASHIDTFDPKPRSPNMRARNCPPPTCRPSARPARRCLRRSSSKSTGKAASK